MAWHVSGVKSGDADGGERAGGGSAAFAFSPRTCAGLRLAHHRRRRSGAVAMGVACPAWAMDRGLWLIGLNVVSAAEAAATAAAAKERGAEPAGE